MKTLFIFAVMIFAVSGAVFAQTTTKIVKINEKFSLSLNQKGFIKAEKLNVEFMTVLEDSRCPEDVDCVWAGNAKIRIKVSKGKESKFFELNTNLDPQYIHFKDYSITLEELKPELKSNANQKTIKYAATFSVSKIIIFPQ